MRVAKVETAPVQKAKLVAVPSLNLFIPDLTSSSAKSVNQPCQDSEGNRILICLLTNNKNII